MKVTTVPDLVDFLTKFMNKYESDFNEVIDRIIWHKPEEMLPEIPEGKNRIRVLVWWLYDDMGLIEYRRIDDNYCSFYGHGDVDISPSGIKFWRYADEPEL